MGYVIYLFCNLGIGWGSYYKMAHLYPFIGVTMYTVLMLMITDTQKEKARFITSITSTVLSAIALFVLWSAINSLRSAG